MEQGLGTLEPSGADMLGNTDAYVVSKKYPIKVEKNGLLVSEILHDYYLGAGQMAYQKNRYSIFADSRGLKWDSNGFTNLNDVFKGYSNDIASFSTMFTGASALAEGKAEFLKASAIAMSALYYFSDDEISKHLNIFFKNLHSKIIAE